METPIQRKIRARGHLVNHLEQMNYLSLIPIKESNLLSIEQTDYIFNEYKKCNYSSHKFLLEFNNTIIQNIKAELLKLNVSFYLIAEFSFDSGLLPLETLSQFNSMFNFSDLGFYRVTLLNSDLTNELTFWEEDDGKLEIEIKGETFFRSLEVFLKNSMDD